MSVRAYYDSHGSGKGQNTSSMGFAGSLAVGPHLFFIPQGDGYDGTVAVYTYEDYNSNKPAGDTFTEAAYWKYRDLTTINSVACGFSGAVLNYTSTTTTSNPAIPGQSPVVTSNNWIYFIPKQNSVLVAWLISSTAGVNTPDINLNTAPIITFDLSSVTSLCTGFSGGVSSGRYVYLVPNASSGGTQSGTIIRFDSYNSVSSSGSYTTFDAKTVNSACVGFSGAAFDGRYIYFAPNNGGTSGLITCYDTTGSFTNPSSYSTYNLATQVNSNAVGYSRVVYDGKKYVYYIPYYNGITSTYSGLIVQFDKRYAVTNRFAYNTLDLTKPIPTYGGSGFTGGVFDNFGNLYLVPSQQGPIHPPAGDVTLIREPQFGMTVSTSFSTSNSSPQSNLSYGFSGGSVQSNGSYIYLAPNANTTYSGQVTQINTNPQFSPVR